MGLITKIESRIIGYFVPFADNPPVGWREIPVLMQSMQGFSLSNPADFGTSRSNKLNNNDLPAYQKASNYRNIEPEIVMNAHCAVHINIGLEVYYAKKGDPEIDKKRIFLGKEGTLPART